MSIATVLGIVLSMLVVFLGTSEKAAILDLLNGHTWLRNTQDGTLTLVNDATASPELNLKLDDIAGHDVRITQDGRVAVLVDPVKRRYAAIDLGRYGLTGTTSSGEGTVDIVPDGTALYVIDQESGQIERRDGADPSRELATSTKLQGPLTRGVVDRHDELWVGGPTSGKVYGIAVRKGNLDVTERVAVAERGTPLELGLVDGAVTVLIKKAPGKIVTIDDGTARSRVTLGLSGDATRWSMPRSVEKGPLPVVVADSGILVLVDGSTVVSIGLSGRVGHTFEEPVVFQGKVYVGDINAGEVIVIDPESPQSEPAVIALPGAQDRGIDLVAGANVLYLKGRDSAYAVHIDARGEQTDIRTEDPQIPSNDPPPQQPQQQQPLVAPSRDSQLTDIVIPPSKPDPPISPVAQAGNATVSVSWGADAWR